MSPWTRMAIFAVFWAIAGPFLIDHLYPAYLLIRNHPNFLKKVNEFSEYKIAFEDEVRNCEDMVMDEQRGAVILSCDAGRDKWNTVMGTFINPTEVAGVLWYYKYPKYTWDEKPQIHQLQMDGLNVSQWMNFHPLGLGYRAKTRTLYVVNHAQSGPSIEIFEVNKQVTGITHQRTITHPLLHTPNSISPISNHEVYITNNHKHEIRDERIKATLETYLSYPGGSVVYINFKTNTTRIAVDNIPFANGIIVLNSTHIAVASTTTPSVSIYSISPTTRDLTLKLKMSVPFWVDNLKTDSSGTLLMAGHPWAPAVSKIAKTNHLYKYVRDRAEGLPLEERPRAPSWVAEWDGNEEGKIRDLYVGSEFGTSTSVVRDVGRGVAFVVGLYERGVMMFKV